MQPDARGFGLVKEVGRDGLPHVDAQLLPCVTLGKNVMRKALGYEASVALLGHVKHDFHARTMALANTVGKPPPLAAETLTHGKPTVRGLRYPVSMILELLAREHDAEGDPG
jgi:hypothetical protein